MRLKWFWFAAIFAIVAAKDHDHHHDDNDQTKHEQVHLSLGADETEMVITWATVHSIDDAGVVQYGLTPENLTSIAKADVKHFHKDGANFYTYRALLVDLKPAIKYYYRVGSDGSSWSAVFHFRTFPSGNRWTPRFAIFGDLGYEEGKSLPFLTKDVVVNDAYDVVFHVGDIAYDLHERDGKQGNDFMRSIEPVAARVPYMTCPGNHEDKSNFSHYDARFTMIGDRRSASSSSSAHKNQNSLSSINNHFHSFDIGPAHIILFSTEYYYFTEYGWDQIERQYAWLEADLARANENRAHRPWIIVMGHRPVYCLKKGDESCLERYERTKIRRGIKMHDKKHAERKYGLESLFYKYGVDLQFYGHEHFYARMLPIYDYKVMGGSSDNPYDNPHAPVHIITGSAGNRQHHPEFNPHLKDWVAAHHFDYGYTRLTFKDERHIVLEQTSDDKGGVVIDKIDIIKHTNLPKWLLQD